MFYHRNLNFQMLLLPVRRVSDICAEAGDDLKPLRDWRLTSDIMETHLGDLSVWCGRLHPSGPLESAQTNTGNYSQILFGPGEVPPPELSSPSSSSSSTSSSSCLHSVKTGVWAQMSPLPDSSWSPRHSYVSVGVQTSQRFFSFFGYISTCIPVTATTNASPQHRHSTPPEALQ